MGVSGCGVLGGGADGLSSPLCFALLVRLLPFSLGFELPLLVSPSVRGPPRVGIPLLLHSCLSGGLVPS